MKALLFLAIYSFAPSLIISCPFIIFWSELTYLLLCFDDRIFILSFTHPYIDLPVCLNSKIYMVSEIMWKLDEPNEVHLGKVYSVCLLEYLIQCRSILILLKYVGEAFS